MAAKSLPYQRSSRLEYHWLFLSHIRQCYEAGLDSTVFLQPVLGLPSARDGYLDSTENRVILLTDAQRETFVLCCAVLFTPLALLSSARPPRPEILSCIGLSLDFTYIKAQD